MLLAGHYRQSLNFTFKAVDAARASLARIDDFVARLREMGDADGVSGDREASQSWIEKAESSFREAMDDDLNVSEALASVFEMVHEGNRLLDRGVVSGVDCAAALDVLIRLDSVLGVLFGEDDSPDDDLIELVRLRGLARDSRDWAEADRIRDELAQRGWTVRDTPEGPKLKRV